MRYRRALLRICICSGLLVAGHATRGQCNEGNIGWLSRMLKIKHTFSQPASITYTTKPSSVYEIPFFLVVYASFVKAEGGPYFYVWMDHQRSKVPTDIKQGDPLTFHLAGGAVVSTASLADYPGIKGQSLGFYPMTATDLATLSTATVDSIAVNMHPPPGASAEAERVMLRLSDRNKRRISEWAACVMNP